MEKLTKYTILVDLKTVGRVLLVHGLFGFVMVLNKEYATILENWLENGIYEITTSKENELYRYLKSKKYILSEKEEELEKTQLTAKLIDRHKSIIENPHSATFILSYRCNFKCPYCFEKSVDRNTPILSKDQVDMALSMYPADSIEHISFYGGEPFLPEHLTIIEYITKKMPFVEYTALTNGYFLEKFIPILKDLKIKHIQVTLDGNKNIHNKTRVLENGDGTFDVIMKGIDLAISNGIPIKIRMNISKQNAESCFELKEKLSEQYGSQSLLSFDIQELFQYGTSEKEELSKQIIEQSDVGIENSNLNGMPSLARFFYNRKPLVPTIYGCTSGIANRIFDPYGNMYSCYLGVGNPNKSIGRYFPNVEFKKDSILTRTTLKMKKCSECKYEFLCGGGCPNPVVDQNGNPNYPNCQKMEHLFTYLIPQLYRKYMYKKEE